MSIRLSVLTAILISTGVMAAAANPEPSANSLKTSVGDKRAKSLAALGKRLFVDTNLSADGKVSCATCHIPEKAFSDGRLVAVGVHGLRGTRNTPSLWNVALLPNQFWDGRRSTLEQQALDPLLNPREHAMQDKDTILSILRSAPYYRNGFASAFGISQNEISLTQVVAALVAFERTLISTDSAFDLYLYKNEKQSMSDAARRGLDLFRGRAECASCHFIDDARAALTDYQFHSLGVSLDSIAPRLAEVTQRVNATDRKDLDQLITTDEDVAALGRFAVTKDPRDIGRFRTPSLRNVTLTAPYMHDGSVPTLEAAVDWEVYYRSLERGAPLILTPREKADLVAFLNALTSANATSDQGY